MARKRDNQTPSSLTSLLSPPPRPLSPLPLPTINTVLTEIEDNRRFNPDPWPMTTLGTPASVRVSQRGVNLRGNLRKLHAGTKSPLLFSGPKGVIKCVRRKSRREVLFAFNKQRKRGQNGGRYRRNSWSKIKC